MGELLQLRNQPSGVGFVVTSLVPVGTEIVVGLVTLSIQYAETKIECATATWARPRRLIYRACWAAR